MAQQRKSISIIIPNYNGRALLEQYLPYTLKSIANAGIEHEIIVVDDCSTDDSTMFIRQQYPEVKLVINPQNKGFSYSCNRGIACARMDLIFLLNSDIKLTGNYFDHLWKYFSMPETFGVMGRVLDMHSCALQDAARLPKLNGLKLKTGSFYYNLNHDDSPTFYLSGANALIDAEKLKAIGGFNPLFSPFYVEDIELSLRAWRLNWRCYYEHEAICFHEVSATTKKYRTRRSVKIIYYRNRFLLHAIHLDGLALVLWFMQITLIDMLPKLLIGQFWILSSFRAFLKETKQVQHSRLKLKALMLEHFSTTSTFDVLHKIKQFSKTKKRVLIEV